MTNNVDIVSTGICLNKKEWFGVAASRKTGRVCNFVFMSLVITAIKLVAVYIVTLKLYDQFYDPQGQVVNLTTFEDTGFKASQDSPINYGTYNLASREVYQSSSNNTDINNLFVEPNSANSKSAMITRISKWVLRQDQTLFKVIVNIMITLWICQSSISETLYNFKRMRYYQNNSGLEFFDTVFYSYLALLCWVNIIIAFRIIQLTDVSAQLAVNAPGMILSFLIAKILSEFDEIAAGTYVNLFVYSTDDGNDLLAEQGYEVTQADGSVRNVSRKCEFYQYNEELTVKDIKAVQTWCQILIYLIFCRELFGFLSMFPMTKMYAISGLDLSQLMGSYDDDFKVQWQINFWLQFYTFLPFTMLKIIELQMVDTTSDTAPIKEIELGEIEKKEESDLEKKVEVVEDKKEDAEEKKEGDDADVPKDEQPSVQEDDKDKILNSEDSNAVKVADKPKTPTSLVKRLPNIIAMNCVILFPIVLEHMANKFSPIFYRNEVVYPINDVVFCNLTTNVVFQNSADDWRAALAYTNSTGNRLCTNTEIQNLFDKSPNNSLTFAGAYIPTCQSPQEICKETDFDFVNAFKGNFGKVNFNELALSARRELGFNKIGDLYNYDKKKNPTLGGIWCSCDMNDGGLKLFTTARANFIDAYDTWTESLDKKDTKKYLEAGIIYDEALGNYTLGLEQELKWLAKGGEKISMEIDAQLGRNLACAKLRYVNEDDDERKKPLNIDKKVWLKAPQKICMEEETPVEADVEEQVDENN